MDGMKETRKRETNRKIRRKDGNKVGISTWRMRGTGRVGNK